MVVVVVVAAVVQPVAAVVDSEVVLVEAMALLRTVVVVGAMVLLAATCLVAAGTYRSTAFEVRHGEANCQADTVAVTVDALVATTPTEQVLTISTITAHDQLYRLQLSSQSHPERSTDE